MRTYFSWGGPTDHRPSEGGQTVFFLLPEFVPHVAGFWRAQAQINHLKRRLSPTLRAGGQVLDLRTTTSQNCEAVPKRAHIYVRLIGVCKAYRLIGVCKAYIM